MELKFLNPVHKAGKNITVRRGTKWVNLNAAVVEGLTRSARPITTKVMRFCDIEDKDIKNEHDPKCQNKEGLLVAMEKAYPDFDPREICTLVEYECEKEELDFIKEEKSDGNKKRN